MSAKASSRKGTGVDLSAPRNVSPTVASIAGFNSSTTDARFFAWGKYVRTKAITASYNSSGSAGVAATPEAPDVPTSTRFVSSIAIKITRQLHHRDPPTMDSNNVRNDNRS